MYTFTSGMILSSHEVLPSHEASLGAQGGTPKVSVLGSREIAH